MRKSSGANRPLLGLFAGEEFFVQTAEGLGAVYDPPVSLADLTAAAIEILSRNPNGFFLMVEGGRIDHAHHDGNAYRSLEDMVAFDNAISAEAAPRAAP